MAYAALDSLATVLDFTLDHRCCRVCRGASENCIVLDKKQRIQRLHENIVFLFTFYEDFPREAAEFEARVTNAANQAKLLFHNLKPRDSSPNCFQSLTLWCCKNSRRLADHKPETFCQELEELIVETDLIREEAMKIKISRKNPISSRVTGDGNDAAIGIEQDLLEMKSRVCGESPELQIIPIVGMGGIGKTTLARYAYDDLSNVYHFDVRVWVTISQSYHLKGILLSLLRSIKNLYKIVDLFGGEDYMYMNEEILKENVYRHLKGRRYLIVMDDVWDTNVWDDLRMMFPDDVNGSRIIITTRELSVASYVDSLRRPHEMHLLHVDQSWSLLKAKVFGLEDCPPELEKIGEFIAEKCRGLPLAIVVIAGVLINQDKDTWEEVARNVSKAVNASDEQFYDILSLSYGNLPNHLRHCFLYMGGFPEDYEINVSTLVRLWAAEGFLESDESKDMEELGDEYLEDLVKRSLAMISKKRYDGKIKTVKIHDLLRELCLRRSRDENFLCTINNFSGSFPSGIENSKRLSICCNVSGDIPNMKNSSIHTILLFKNWAFDSWKSYSHLRVVDALTVTLRSTCPVRYIGKLIHLRYLALRCEGIRGTLSLVSESLCQLRNLQTLIVRAKEDRFPFMASSDYS